MHWREITASESINHNESHLKQSGGYQRILDPEQSNKQSNIYSTRPYISLSSSFLACHIALHAMHYANFPAKRTTLVMHASQTQQMPRTHTRPQYRPIESRNSKQ